MSNHPQAYPRYSDNWSIYYGYKEELAGTNKCERCGRCCMAWPCHFELPIKRLQRWRLERFTRGKVRPKEWDGGIFGIYKRRGVEPIFKDGRCPFLTGVCEPHTCEIIKRFKFMRPVILEGIRCECPVEYLLNPT